MGYVFHTPPSFSSLGTRSFVSYRADGGVDYAAQGLSNGEKNDLAQNLWFKGGLATSRPAFGESGEALTGVRHMAKEFFGAVLLHIGTSLYKFENQVVTTLLEGLPDKKSVPVEFAGKLYLYCDTHMYCIDRSFTAKEVFPTAPLYASGRAGDMEIGSVVSGFKPNLLAPFVTVEFSGAKQIGTRIGYRFPRDMDYTRPYEVYFEGKPVKPPELVVENKTFSFQTLDQTTANTVKICYYSHALPSDTGKLLAACTVATAYGGGTIQGTRVFLAGNPEKPGEYYMSELGDPLAFFEGSQGSLGESTGNITAFSKQSGDLLIFTESSVNRMRYQYQSGEGGYFSTKTLHAGIGCDMPESVALAGNRTVFADAKSGVYLVDSVELFDRMSIVPISHNITSPDSGKGFFAQSLVNRKAASACVYDRKYLLSMGNTVFVWDFGAADYSGSAASAEKRLIWTEWDCPEGLRFCTSGETLAAWQENENSCRLFVQTAGKNVPFVLDSGGMDLGQPHVEKDVRRFAVECKASRKTVLYFAFYADGQLYCSEKVPAEPEKDGMAHLSIPLPRYRCHRFRFVISGQEPEVGLMNMRVDFRILKKQR